MIEQIIEWDKELFLFFNGFHSSTFDSIMFFVSEKEVWFPLYLLLIVSIFLRIKKYAFIIVLAAIAAVGASDFTTSGIMKPAFERYRPSREPLLEGKVHIVNDYRGGRFGFASSHAANSFAIGVFFFLLYRFKYSWTWILLLWASVVSYSRVYLGVHYPGDIIVGAIIGSMFAYIFYRISIKLIANKFPDTYSSYFEYGAIRR